MFLWRRSTFLYWTFISFTACSRFLDSELIFWFYIENSYITWLFKTENCTLIFIISCAVPKFLYDKDFCNVGVLISIIVFEAVLPKTPGSSSEGSEISFSEVLGCTLDISIEGLAVGKGTYFSFKQIKTFDSFLLNMTFWVISPSITSSASSLFILVA